MQRDYKKNIKGIIKILEGGSKKLMRELEKERDSLSKHEQYENALSVQKKIQSLSIITTPFHRPFEYDVNPNLRVDIRLGEMTELMNALNISGLNLQLLHRIECYDISNTQGVYATGSMVVFTDGEKDSSQYRRFKIKKDGSPNDFAMMKEVLMRRFHHDGWNMPDLVVVDGGKGQVSSALEALAARQITIPLIGLAKREETIIIPNKPAIASKDSFIELSLPKDSKGLLLIRRIRDEAHRFAITYHRNLRNKNAFLS
jgi:excinuclease ABC subunit C